MTKTELYDFFEQKFAKRAIQLVDDEWTVVGKTCRITVDESGEIDIFFCNHENIAAGLGTSALRNRLEAFKHRANRLAVELNGEGYIKTRVKDKIFLQRALVGIPKKREISEEQLANLKKFQIVKKKC